MAKRSRLALVLFTAACSGNPNTAGVSDPAEVVAVPLTAATQSIATSRMTHQDLVPPWSLTANDGSGLMLTRVEAKAVFEGPLAYTELHLYFHNPEDRRREGTFQITLPPHAAVSRFAMENDGQWMEAEVVEKQLARRAYDDFLHRRQDPALLEKSEGNQFSAKVFPIAPKADKHIVISYSQELPGARYALPLRGLPKIERVDVELATMGEGGKRTMQTLSQRNWTPDRDFISDVKVSAAAVMSGGLVATQLSVFDPAEAQASEPPKSMTLLVDTSASRGLGFDGYVKSVRALVGKLPADMPLDVFAFDQDHEQVFSGRAGDWGDAQDKKLVERGAAGASDLAQALAAIGGQAKSRVVVVTDGVITAGAEHAELVATAKQLKTDRIDVVLAGGIRDDVAATELVRALPHAGAVLDFEDGAEEVASELAQPVRVDVPIEIPGAAWVYPKVIASARAGTSTMVFARLAKPTQTLDVIVGGKKRTIAMQAGTAPLVERALGSAEIEELEAKLPAFKGAEAAALRAQIAQKSVAARVISSQTSLLVLESDNDYARYGIDRKALADVLVVGANGAIVRTHRQASPQAQQIAQPKMPILGKHSGFKDETKKSLARNDGDQLDHADKRKDKVDAKEDFDGAEDDLKNMAPGASMGSAAGGDEGGVAGGVVDGKVNAVPGPQLADPKPEPPPPPATMRPPADHATRAVTTPSPTNQPSRPMHGEAAGAPDIDRDEVLDQSDREQTRDPWPPKDAPVALTGELATIEKAIARRDVDGALAKARDWHVKEPGNVLALIGLGDALEAKGSTVTAARVYGSIIDLFPGRADMRRFAGERLARLAKAKGSTAQDLIVDTYRRAVADRPDHMTGHRLLAYALLRAGKKSDAFDAILAAIDQPYRNDSYAGGERTLADDAGMIAASLIAESPSKRKDVLAALAKRNLKLATQASTRFILYWETDANDVDFHIQDSHGGHAFYGHKQLASGGELYADITTGYGPECFAIPGTPKAGPYRLSINYYSQGPMGYGMGLLEIQKFDGKGGLTFEDRPYVIMNDHAFVDLGKF